MQLLSIIENKLDVKKTFNFYYLFDHTLSDMSFKLVWEDTFSNHGPVDRNKWDFDIGGSGWGSLTLL